MFARRAIVLCNGEPPSRTLIREVIQPRDFVVAADGGANVARVYSIRPHVVIGDMDSIRPSTRRFFSSSLIIQLDRQDNTDLEKALDFLVARKMKQAIILGATGKRLDFTLGNLSVLWKYAKTLSIELRGDGWRALPVISRIKVRARRGTTVSLIPFGRCVGITLKGLKYPLTNERMNVGEIGVSNVVTSSPFSVKVKTGNMLLFVMNGLRD